jgi:FKBP-type peptidyl-prolyl cis-trans isomerase
MIDEARYSYPMIGKIIAGLVIIILIIGGAYWYTTRDAITSTDATSQEQASPQVAGQDAVVGTGATAVPNSRVEVLYVGMLEDGTVFDSSANNDNQPFAFTLGEPGVIPGFQFGINGMKEGGERRISIPPELGYGNVDVHQDQNDPTSPIIIPANSTLIFDVKLIKVTEIATPPAVNSADSEEE